MSDLKYMTGLVKAASMGGFDAVISTPKVDMDMEVVLPKGLINRDAYLANPLVYWAHEWVYNPAAEPIGKATRLDVHDDRIESTAEYAPTAKAQNIRALVSGGFVRKTSIGFDSLEMAEIAGIPTHTRWALREYSIVPMPANTDATITGVKSALSWLAEQMPGELPDYHTTTLVLSVDADKLLAALELPGWTLDSTPDGLAVVEHKRVIARITPRRMVRRVA
jgi:HK97 family phage prohead protease